MFIPTDALLDCPADHQELFLQEGKGIGLSNRCFTEDCIRLRITCYQVEGGWLIGGHPDALWQLLQTWVTPKMKNPDLLDRILDFFLGLLGLIVFPAVVIFFTGV